MRYILIYIILLLIQSFGGLGVQIASNNGYVHMAAESPELLTRNQSMVATGSPSIMLPYNLVESVRASGDISMEFRVKMFDVAGLPQLLLAPGVNQPSDSGITRYESPTLYYGDDQRVHFLFWDNGGAPAVSQVLNLTDGEWHMISAVLSNSTSKYYAIFVDGESVLEGFRTPGQYSYTWAFPPPYHFIAGGGCKNGTVWPGIPGDIRECFFNGYIDEFRLWSKALGQTEIRKNLESNIFGDEEGLVYALSFDQLVPDFPKYFPGVNPTTNNSLLFGRGGGYSQSVAFIESVMTVDTIYVDLNETHAQTTLIYVNPSNTSEFHPYGRNNFFFNNDTRLVNMSQPQEFAAGSTTSFNITWAKANGPTFYYQFGGLKEAISMSVTTYQPPVTAPVNEPIDSREPVADVVVDPPQADHNAVAIAVGVTVPVVVVGVGAAVLAVLLIRRKKKAAKEKTFADKQGAIIQSRKIEIKNKIGSGSFGDVWKGVWRGKEVAIKEVKSGADASFLNEIKIMAKLPPHENVMEVYGAIIDADSPSLVLEYCGGGSLDFLLYDSDVPIREEDMLKLALGVARGMEHLHKYNIVHRDLAARNVLLTTDHTPKICDFGMSRTVAERNISNKTKNDMGPIRWMAPEALEQEYSTKTDVWSYGIVLSEITSRREPHTDVDPLKIALQIRDEKMTPKIVDACPPALADLMRMCWNPNPSERPEFSKIVELLELVVQKK